jgi:hypothetical protein
VVRALETGQSRGEYAPIGLSTNLAARMQTAAPVGSIAVTDATRKLCEGYFTFRLLGPTAVKGISESVQVWEVTGLGPLRTRLQRAVSRGLTRFIGREREMESLRHAAALARTGHGQIVAAIADPGVGKSRLYHEFKLISQSDWTILEALTLSGMALCIMGEYLQARQRLARAESLYSHARISLYGPASFCFQATTLGCMGYADQALDHCRRGLVLAREQSDPYTRVGALNQAAIFHAQRREGQRSLELADETLQVATEYGFQQFSAFAIIDRGWALIELNRAEEGLAELRQGLLQGPQLGYSIYCAALAEGLGKVGSVADGLRVLADGLDSSDRTGDAEMKAELWRMRGDLLLWQDEQCGSNCQAEAESCFRQGIELARHQQAKWWELRATTSLARLLAKQTRRAGARAMLAEIYSWFTEGFDTTDLKEAQQLLEQLGA